MAEVAFITAGASRPSSLTAHPGVILVPERGGAWRLPLAPREVEHANLAATWTEVARPGRKPLLIHSGGKLRTMSLELTVGYLDYDRPVEAELAKLRTLAAGTDRVRFVSYGQSEAGWWRITDASMRSVLRQHGTNRITRATVSLSLTESSDFALPSPVSRAKSKTPNVKSYPKRPLTAAERRGVLDTGSAAANNLLDRNRYRPGYSLGPDGSWYQISATRYGMRKYTVKKGDTLITIAMRRYGNGNSWRWIAALNKIKDPRKIRPGQVIWLALTDWDK